MFYDYIFIISDGTGLCMETVSYCATLNLSELC